MIYGDLTVSNSTIAPAPVDPTDPVSPPEPPIDATLDDQLLIASATTVLLPTLDLTAELLDGPLVDAALAPPTLPSTPAQATFGNPFERTSEERRFLTSGTSRSSRSEGASGSLFSSGDLSTVERQTLTEQVTRGIESGLASGADPAALAAQLESQYPGIDPDRLRQLIAELTD